MSEVIELLDEIVLLLSEKHDINDNEFTKSWGDTLYDYYIVTREAMFSRYIRWRIEFWVVFSMMRYCWNDKMYQ